MTQTKSPGSGGWLRRDFAGGPEAAPRAGYPDQGHGQVAVLPSGLGVVSCLCECGTWLVQLLQVGL